MSKPVTRRHFLALSAAAIAVPGGAAVRVRRDAIRVGIIGMGRRGTELAQNLQALPCAVVAVCEPHQPRLERARVLTGGAPFADWEELVSRDDVDAVVIATPDHLHAPMAVAALESGKDVYCETPMARTVEEAVAVKRVAAETGGMVQIGAQEIWDRPWRAARTLVADGALGELYWCQSSCPRVPNPAFWRGQWDTSGGIASDGVFGRLASMMTNLGLGIPDRVSAAGGVYAERSREVPDSFAITFEYAGGPNLVLTSANAHRNGSPTVIRGRLATLHLDEVTALFEPQDERALRALPASGQHGDLLEDWIESAGARRPCAFGPDRAFPAMVAAVMANEAYRCGRSVSFDPASSRIVPGPPRTECIA